ncbi:hypothetical protein [Thiomicrospira microaerophila]|uniref:hypothetical protein n=1 Tax=Thiomicrospira microaerophila TaxID=406020 RepID=UPI0005C8DEDB|nr:hypothetical protein [Thiomicrospira microaerophila]
MQNPKHILLPNQDGLYLNEKEIPFEDVLKWPVITENKFENWEQSFKTSSIVSPCLILGTDSTSAIGWMMARRQYPTARGLCFESQQAHWRDVDSLDIWTPQPEQLDAEQSDLIAESDNTPDYLPINNLKSTPISEPNAHKRNATHKPDLDKSVKHNTDNPATSYATMKDGNLLYQIYQKSSWGNQAHQVSTMMMEIADRSERNPSLIKRAREHAQLGEHVFKLSEQAKQLFRTEYTKNQDREQATEAVLAWLALQKQGRNKTVIKSIKYLLKKAHDFINSKKRKLRAKPKTSQLQPLTLNNGIHPNSLRHLNPSRQWTVVIDETGSNFNEQAQLLSLNDKTLGRVVSLAIPQRALNNLPPLKAQYHATEASDEENDAVADSLLKSGAGIFGFTVKDQGLTQRQRWFDAIEHLTYWTLLLLPIQPDDETQVKIMIEQLDYGTGSGLLMLIQENIVSRLKTLNSERFAKLHISMAFIPKDGSQYNGYVDTIAHTWGSQARETKKRLQKTQWPIHCLMHPNQTQIERLFLALNAHSPLEPSDWYAICEATASEPKNSLLRNELTKLTALVKQDINQWQMYLQYIQERLNTKQFKLSVLAAALDWLDSARPETQTLPSMVLLYLHSARLAEKNHQGYVDTTLISQIIQLSDQLRDESASEACQAVLRIATATTNNYEFDIAQPHLQKWLDYDVAIPGLLNHAKLHSALGQLYAFQGMGDVAINHFEHAIEHFTKLSNTQAAQRDINQTMTYKLIAQMDNVAWQTDFQTWLTQQKTAKQFARSGYADRYSHHLFLRGLLHDTEQYKPLIDDYLSLTPDWQIEEDYPWPWINTYRGWLLSITGDKQGAQFYFQQAIESCFSRQEASTLNWIGLVISVVSSKLGVNIDAHEKQQARLHAIEKTLPSAPINAISEWINDTCEPTHDEILSQLKILVPFNFH